MNLNDVKQDLIKLFDSINYDKDFIDSVKSFINSYDGTNVSAFSLHMFQLGSMLMRLQTLEEKAKGYDKLNEIGQDFGAFTSQMKEDFERISAGLDPASPSQSSQ